MFISPMLARPLPKNFTIQRGEYAGEEKFDGHRLISEVSDGLQPSLFVKKGITAWSRYGNERTLPTHILEVLQYFPNAVLDGELIVPGNRSYGVTEIDNSPDLVYMIFDLIHLENEDYTDLDYDTRRFCLSGHWPIEVSQDSGPVRRAESRILNSLIDVYAYRDEVWARGGEGLILKKRSGTYQVGKRSKYFIKIKDKKSAVLTVIAWAESRGQIDYRGKYATAVIRDDEGFTTTVKTKNNEELRKLEAEALRTGKDPFIGRKLRIEYQERTPDGSYRHPRWDRWEDE